MKIVCAVAGLVALLIFSAQAQEKKDVAVTLLLSTTVTSSGQPIALPQKNAQLIASIYDVTPGATLPVHKHPYPRYAYVLSGSLRVANSETGRSDTYKTGDFIVESVGQWHTGADIGNEPVKLLIIDMVEKSNRTQCCANNRMEFGCQRDRLSCSTCPNPIGKLHVGTSAAYGSEYDSLRPHWNTSSPRRHRSESGRAPICMSLARAWT